MRLNFLLISFAAILSGYSVSATTWTTSNYGLWNNGANWVGGIAPSYTSADSFYINHPILIDNQVTLLPGGFFLIDSTGGICGHERMLLQTNTVLYNQGILELDSLTAWGGYVYNYIDGMIILSYNGQIGNNGYMWSNGAVSVGPWFECHQPEYSFLTTIEESIPEQELIIYPNPATSELNIINSAHADYMTISDLSGREIIAYPLHNKVETIPLNLFSNGLYLLTFYSTGNRCIEKQKLIIQH